MELYHLRTFVTVAEEGHLTRAAERLYTSQPAISAHIKALEEELGLTLFHRTPRGMQLTVEGEQLLPQAREAQAAAGDVVRRARSLQNELLGTVRIGLNTDAGYLRVTDLHAALSERHPRLELHFLAGMTSANVPDVRSGRLDAAFISGQFSDAQLEAVELDQTPVRVAVPIAWQERVAGASFAQIAALPWIYTSPDCAYFKVMCQLFEAHGVQPAKTLVSDQEEALRQMVKAGIGLALMREDEVEQAAREGYAVALEEPRARIPLYFIYQKRRAGDAVINALIDALVQTWGIARDEEAAKAAG